MPVTAGAVHGSARSTAGIRGRSGPGGGGSIPAARASARTAVAELEAAPPPLPPTARARTERLDALYREIEELKRRNARLREIATAMLRRDASLTVATAAVKAAETMGLADPQAAAAAATAASGRAWPAGERPGTAAAAPAVPPARPSGGAVRTAPDIDADASMPATAASVAAPVPQRPSGGASREAPFMSGTGMTWQLPVPERPGGASARAGPSAPHSQASGNPILPAPPSSLTTQTPADSSRLTASVERVNAGDDRDTAAGQTPDISSLASSNSPAAEAPRPNIRSVRRSAAARVKRTYRSLAPPPQPPARVNPSFDVPEGAPTPEEYLRELSGRTADGRVNPSFASDASSAFASPAALPIASVAAPVWYQPQSWFTQREEGRREGSGVNPSFEASLAVPELEAPAAAPAEPKAKTVPEAVEEAPRVTVTAPEAAVEAPGAPAAASEAAAVPEALAAAREEEAALPGALVAVPGAALAAPEDPAATEAAATLRATQADAATCALPCSDVGSGSSAAVALLDAAYQEGLVSGAGRGRGRGGISSVTHSDAGTARPLHGGSGDLPAAPAPGGSKYDPVTREVGVRERTRGSRGPSKYDPVGLVLQALLRSPARTEAGSTGTSGDRPGPRCASKYDMLGQALEAAAGLPEDLASGKWAARQPRDPLLGRRERPSAAPVVRLQRRARSKYDMADAALSAMESLPEELASGRWAATQGRDLLLDTLSRALERRGEATQERKGPAGPGLLQRLRDGGSAALRAVASAVVPVSSAAARAVTVSLEAASGVVRSMEAQRGQLALAAAPAAAVAGASGQELSMLAFQPGSTSAVGDVVRDAKAKAAVTAVETAAEAVEPVQPAPAPAPAEAPGPAAAEPLPPAPQQLERAVAPPSRPTSLHNGLGSGPISATVAAPAGIDEDAAAVAIPDAVAAAQAPADPQPTAALIVDSSRPPLTTEALKLDLAELAVDLLVYISMRRPGSGSGASPSMDELLERFGSGFAEVASQLAALRRDGALLGRHAAVSRLMRAASKAAGDGEGMWSRLYAMQGAVQAAEAELSAFREECGTAYPLLHGLLSTGDAGQAVSVLCTLCNLVPAADDAGGEEPAARE